MPKILNSILVGFISGIFVSSFLNFGLAFSVFFVFIGCIFVLINFLKFSKSIIFLTTALFLVSFGVGQLRHQQSNTMSKKEKYLQEKIGQKIILEGVVFDEPEEKDNYNRLVLKDEKTGGKILVYLQAYPKHKYGDKLKINGILKKPENFNDFEWTSYLAKDDIYYEMFYPQAELVSVGNGFWVKEKLFTLKNKFLFAIDKAVPEPHSAFLGGITIGAKEGLPKDLQDNFRTTGVAHIVALSGYNITIVAETIMLFLSFLPQYLAISGGVIGVILFAIMTGASATVLRASIMALLALTAKATGRIYTVSWALFLAGFFMVLQNPKILRFDTSFQLSFLATLGLIYLSPIVKNNIGFVTEKLGLREIFSATISAQIAVLPLLIYKTGIVSVVGLPVNFLILPFIPLTMFLGFAVGILGAASYLISIPFAWASYALLQYELFVIDIFSKIPFASVNISGFSEVFLILSYLVIFLLCLFDFQKK